jgi:regulator of protease activity HflC (stomatin/prohibitin superfamily)
MTTQALAAHHEIERRLLSGWLMLPTLLVLLLADIALLIYSLVSASHPREDLTAFWEIFAPAMVALPILLILLKGLFTLQPNEARVLILFGAYKGTVRQSGFHWGNPFYSNGPRTGDGLAAGGSSASESPARGGTATGMRAPRRYIISLRARVLNGDKLKVNDKRGNPIEIAAVIVWRVADTAQAVFDVDNYVRYVQTQSETSLRHIASVYAYDHGEEDEVTLRSGVDEVSQALRKELQERLAKAGVIVDEARLTHLAYSPEIAQAMLRRQQAEAVIAARTKIVHGAVTMVEMALRDLAEKHVVDLDDERKASMVSNLMVVLCGDSEVHPVVNAGTLYN